MVCLFQEALNHPSLDPEIADAIKDLIEAAGKERAPGRNVDFDLLDYIVPAYYVLTTAKHLPIFPGMTELNMATDPEPAEDLTDFYKETRSAGFGKEVKRRIMLGTFVLSAGYYDAYFTQSQKVRKLLCDKTTLIFKDSDFILMPTSPSTAFKAGEKMNDPIAMYLADIYTVMANLTGIPAISLPLFRHSNGMPFGLQVMANRFDELSLLQHFEMLMSFATS